MQGILIHNMRLERIGDISYRIKYILCIIFNFHMYLFHKKLKLFDFEVFPIIMEIFSIIVLVLLNPKNVLCSYWVFFTLYFRHVFE